MDHRLRKVKIKMSLTINPLQPFVLKGQADISANYLESLTHLYQPIIGPESMGLYLTLMSMPTTVHLDSRRSLRHQILLLHLNIGIKELNEARIKLEAVGLMRTYRDMKSNSNPVHQTILYDLKLPLLNQAFFQDALLSTALLNQLGEKDYEELTTLLTVEAIDEDRYAEETSTFQKALYPIQVNEAATKVIDEQPDKVHNYAPGLEYSRFISYVISEGINHSELTEELKEQIYAIHDIYGNSESELANLVYLAMDKTTGNVNLNDLKKIAQRQNKKAESNWQSNLEQDQLEPRTESNRTSRMYTKEEVEDRRQQLKAQHPELAPGAVQLVISCEQMPSNAFLNKMKQAKKTFATDSEHFYIRDLAEKTRLNEHVVNFLIYYLLVINDRPNIYKGELQRVASEWEQEELTNIPKAMQYVKEQRKKKEIEQKQRENRSNYKKRGQSQHQEIIPSWMKDKEQSEQQQETPQTASQPQYSEDEMRKRLNELIGEEGDS